MYVVLPRPSGEHDATKVDGVGSEGFPAHDFQPGDVVVNVPGHVDNVQLLAEGPLEGRGSPHVTKHLGINAPSIGIDKPTCGSRDKTNKYCRLE